MNSQIIEGTAEDYSSTVGIVVTKWNSFITDELLEGALHTLASKGIGDEQITVVRCPGAFEIPFTSKKLLSKVDGVITLGAVIRGDTPHFDYVCDAVTRGVTDLNTEGNKPVVFGVLTTDNVKQARQRAGLEGDGANKGKEAALALLEMLSLTKQIDQL